MSDESLRDQQSVMPRQKLTTNGPLLLMYDQNSTRSQPKFPQVLKSLQLNK